MTFDQAFGPQADNQDDESVESIVDIIEEEMAGAGTNPRPDDPSREMDLMVADLLRFLAVDPGEEAIDTDL